MMKKVKKTGPGKMLAKGQEKNDNSTKQPTESEKLWGASERKTR